MANGPVPKFVVKTASTGSPHSLRELYRTLVKTKTKKTKTKPKFIVIVSKNLSETASNAANE